MLVIPITRRESQHHLGYLALAGVAAALISIVAQWNESSLSFGGMIFQDNFGHFSRFLLVFSVGAVILSSIDYLRRDNLLRAEYFSLLLFAALGMCLMAISADLIVTFLGIEILSIATYVLAAYRREEMKSIESALKYFILGAFSTAFLLYGIAFIYGATASTRYLEIARTVSAADSWSISLLIGLGLMIVGFGFKASLAPFHVWAPDVYEGAPVPITAHLAVASKAAAFVALLRILFQVLPALSESWQVLLWLSAVVTMGIGNIAALTQTNIKRMLAYSSIAHAGYLLVGVVANNSLGAQSILFYLLAYAFMNLGAFTVVQLIGRRNELKMQIEDFAGIGFRMPFLGIALSVFLISLAGIPLTAGFTGKLFLFAAAIQSGMYWLVVFALLASAIGLYYYLRILVLMYMKEPEADLSGIGLPLTARVVIVIMLAGTLYLGLFPGAVLKLASEAVVF